MEEEFLNREKYLRVKKFMKLNKEKILFLGKKGNFYISYLLKIIYLFLNTNATILLIK